MPPPESSYLVKAGFQSVWILADGRLRLDGDLSVSRALGDLPFIERGLIATPSLSSWISIDKDFHGMGVPTFLVLATDGLFESMGPQEVCAATHELAQGKTLSCLDTVFSLSSVPSALTFCKGTISTTSVLRLS